MKTKLPYIFLVLVCLVLFVFNLGAYPLLGLDESLYAEVSRHMAASGDYIVPHYNGQPFYDKPPLVYWMQAACIDLLGVNSTAARLPSAVMAILLIAWTVCLTSKLYSRKAGVYSGFTLAVCLLTVGLARMAILDMTLAVMVSFALGTFILAYSRKASRLAYLWSWAGLGLSVMAKGPIGAVLVGLVILVFLGIRKDLKELRNTYPLLGIPIALAISLPWYIAVNIQTHGSFLQEFLFHQNIDRALGKDFQHNSNPLYYVPVFLAGFLPGSIFLPAAIKYRKDDRTIDNTIPLFLIVWASAVFALFSVIVSKLPGYIYPMYPASAVLVGAWWARQDVKGLKWSGVFCTGALVLFALAILLAQSRVQLESQSLQHVLIAMSISILAGGIASLVFAFKANKPVCFALLTAGYAVFLAIAVLAGMPAYSRISDGPAKDVAEYILSNYPESHDIIAFDYNQKQANLPSLPFYTHQQVSFIWDPVQLHSDLAKPGKAIVVTEAVTPGQYLQGLREVERFGKYVVYMEK